MTHEDFSARLKELEDDFAKKKNDLQDEYLRLNGNVEIGDIIVSDEKKIRVHQINFMMNRGRLLSVVYGGYKVTALGQEYKNKAQDSIDEKRTKIVIKHEEEKQLFN